MKKKKLCFTAALMAVCMTVSPVASVLAETQSVANTASLNEITVEEGQQGKTTDKPAVDAQVIDDSAKPEDPSNPEEPSNPEDPTEPEEPSKPENINKWVEENGKWKYYDENGIFVVNAWKNIDGKKYYFDKDGNRQSGWVYIDGLWYFLQSTGEMLTGWQKVDGKWFLLQSTGERLDGWQKVNTNWYYLEEGAGMQTGWLYDGYNWFYLKEDGAMVTGWYFGGNQWFYFNDSGYMLTGWQYSGDKWYYLKDSGAMMTGWIQGGADWFYLESNGQMSIGWKYMAGRWYYFEPTGKMATGWKYTDNQWYYLHASGEMQIGWMQNGTQWYYMNEKGEMQTGWTNVNGQSYYMDDSGLMQTGWIGEYYCGSNGAWIPGYTADSTMKAEGGTWVKNGAGWWFKRDDGSYPANTWSRIGGQRYYFNADGYMLTDWQYIGGLKYYFNSSGALVQNVDSIIGTQSSYEIEINKQENCITVYAQDGSNGYIIPVKAIVCSTGVDTPLGTFSTQNKYRWHELQGPTYGQFCTRIVGGILFHSVPCSQPNNRAVITKYYNQLGSTASAGCVRLTVEDAKWIYDHCSLRTTVRIYNGSTPSPFDKPVPVKIPAGQTWDPTDPTL